MYECFLTSLYSDLKAINYLEFMLLIHMQMLLWRSAQRDRSVLKQLLEQLHQSPASEAGENHYEAEIHGRSWWIIALKASENN